MALRMIRQSGMQSNQLVLTLVLRWIVCETCYEPVIARAEVKGTDEAILRFLHVVHAAGTHHDCCQKQRRGRAIP